MIGWDSTCFEPLEKLSVLACFSKGVKCLWTLSRTISEGFLMLFWAPMFNSLWSLKEIMTNLVIWNNINIFHYISRGQKFKISLCGDQGRSRDTISPEALSKRPLLVTAAEPRLTLYHSKTSLCGHLTCPTPLPYMHQTSLSPVSLLNMYLAL